MLDLVLAATAVLMLAALLSVVAYEEDRVVLAVGSTLTIGACLVGASASAVVLFAGESTERSLELGLPLGTLHVGMDALSAFFLLCLFLVSGLAATYGVGYLEAHIGKRRIAPAIAWLAVLVASMALVVVARDGVLFLVAWELMSVSSFFLLTFEHDREDVRRAGITYLIASHLGFVLLLVVFGLLGRGTDSFDFATWARTGAPSGLAGACFVLSVVGFGTKAGFWPVHVWLPDAYPAAPSHVSSLMSGVMSKMGIYGLLRVIGLLGAPPAWWGVVLLGVGAVSALIGILEALAQRDIKRAIAYSSIENVGIVAIGLGLGLIGKASGDASVAWLGIGGALLHVLNHGLMKGVLFQGAGALLQVTGTRNMDLYGALARRMPATSAAMLVASIAIAGLPPLNGFVGEWLIYVGALRGAAQLPGSLAVVAVAVVPVLALVGGIAAACFVKLWGLTFSGVARSAEAENAVEVGPWMRVTMLLGAIACLVIGLWPAGAMRIVAPAANAIAGPMGEEIAALAPLARITQIGALLLGIVAVIALLRAWLLRNRSITSTEPTWGCGYSAPSASMQYTSTSFAEPALAPFAVVVPMRVERDGPTGYFPETARHDVIVGDMAGERLVVPLTKRFTQLVGRMRIIQSGRLQLYLAYIFVTLVALLVWRLGFAGAP